MVLQSNTDSNVTVSRGRLTYTEILQQPELWPTTLEIVRQSGWANDTADRPVVITGAGTSAYAAAAIAPSWVRAQAVPTTDLLIESVGDIERRSPGFGKSGLLISLGRSGDSPESVAVVKRIKNLFPNVGHLAITCNAAGELARTPGVQAIVLDPRTNDQSLAMTSSFSNLVLAGAALCHADQLASFLPAVCQGAQRQLLDLDQRAARLGSGLVDRVVTLASGNLHPLAYETSLKILEMTAGRIPTLAETFLGLRHGPMSFLTQQSLVLCFLSSSPELRRYEEDLVRELRQKQLGQLIGIVPGGANADLFDEAIPAHAGQAPDYLRVPFEIPFAQLLAYHLSLNHGLDPDSPSPTGAITRVVQKFVIHDASSRDENRNV
jgi:tagatose-6-phosphate ketose/aldose isomerase